MILIASLALTFAALTTLKPVSAYSGTNLYADPAVVMRKDLHVGDTFSVDIRLENATLALVIAFDLSWDPYYLNLTSYSIGDALPGGLLLIGDEDYTTGYIDDISIGVLGAGYDVDNKTAFTVVFEVMHPGNSVIDILGMDCYDQFLFSFLSGDSPYDCTVHLSEVLTHETVWNMVSYYVVTESNSTITHFNFSQSAKMVYFNATGKDGIGYVNVTIPKSLLWVNTSKPEPYWQIFIDYGWHLNITEGNWLENATHSFVYFTYTHSEQFIEVRGNEVVPEFPTLIIPFIILVATLIALVSVRKVYIPQRKR